MCTSTTCPASDATAGWNPDAYIDDDAQASQGDDDDEQDRR